MVRRKRKPPSRAKYDEENPVIAIRLDRDTARRLRGLAEESNKSLTTVIKENLDLQEDNYITAYDKGYDKGKKEHQIWYYCSICQQRIDIVRGGNAHKAITKYLYDQGWAHETCISRRRPST